MVTSCVYVKCRSYHLFPPEPHGAITSLLQKKDRTALHARGLFMVSQKKPRATCGCPRFLLYCYHRPMGEPRHLCTWATPTSISRIRIVDFQHSYYGPSIPRRVFKTALNHNGKRICCQVFFLHSILMKTHSAFLYSLIYGKKGTFFENIFML
jgi:hypothetical protein